MTNDLISRQAAINAIREMQPELFSAYQHNTYVDKQEVMIRLMALPSTQPEILACGSGELVQENAKLVQAGSSDLISRQVAIDIERNATVDTNPSHFEAHQKFTQFMDDAEISSFGKWQWANGFNTALTAVGIDLKKLPSAQPERQWIPISERLPEEKRNPNTLDFEEVLCSTTFGDVRAYKFGTPLGWKEQHFWNGFEMMDEYVLAWMPLPEPYEGRQDGNK